MPTRILLCRTVWLRHYDARDDDPPYGNHGWVREGNVPHEIKNFLPTATGDLLGFVQVRDWGRINIDRLGADHSDSQIDDVTVIWCAQHPDERGIVVVGWYENATVYRERQPCPEGWGRDDGEWAFRIKGRIESSQLVEAPLRDFVVQPAGLGRDGHIFGQADLRYVAEEFPELTERLLNYIRRQRRLSREAAIRTNRLGGGGDPEENARVEQAAVDHVKAHYRGWTIVDVSASNKGWDLELTRRTESLCIEVKGRTPASPAPVTLTRNERQHFERAAVDRIWGNQYRLALVHEATVVAPSLRIYRHTVANGWRCELTGEGMDAQPLGLMIQPRSDA